MIYSRAMDEEEEYGGLLPRGVLFDTNKRRLTRRIKEDRCNGFVLPMWLCMCKSCELRTVRNVPAELVERKKQTRKEKRLPANG